MVFSDNRIKDTEILMSHERKLFDAMQLDEIYPDYWQERVMTYVISICSIFRKPEAEINAENVYTILVGLRRKYYLSSFRAMIDRANYKKRFKNKVYNCLFEKNRLKILATFLLFDRNIKRMLIAGKK